MSNSRATPSVVRVVLSDYVALLALMGIVVTWGLHILATNGVIFTSRRSGTEVTGGGFLGVAIVATVVLLPLFAYRIYAFIAIFKRGLLCKAEITDINFFKDRGRVEFKYTLHGKDYRTGSPVMKNARTKALNVGQEVDIVVHPEKHSRAFIVDLYR